MKKRFVAFLLVLIMVLGMLPVSALAADMSWTWTVTISGGNYYRSDGIETSTNKYTITKYLDNSGSHEIGYKFEWNANAGGSAYNGGWQLCLTVDGTIVERSTAYVYSKDMSTAQDTWTAPASSQTGPSSHPFTLFLNRFPKADYRYDKNFELNYDANGGEGAPEKQTKTAKDDSVEFVISDTKPTREGYTFKGWSDTATGSAEYQPGGKITVTGKKTIYAVWQQKQPETPAPKTEDIDNKA